MLSIELQTPKIKKKNHIKLKKRNLESIEWRNITSHFQLIEHTHLNYKRMGFFFHIIMLRRKDFSSCFTLTMGVAP